MRRSAGSASSVPGPLPHATASKQSPAIPLDLGDRKPLMRDCQEAGASFRTTSPPFMTKRSFR